MIASQGSRRQQTTYSFDEAGRMTVFTNFNGVATGYGYDDANRLTLISSPVAEYAFTLDGNGNRINETCSEPLTMTDTQSTAAYGYNVYGNRLTSAGPASFYYDNEGQLGGGYGSSYTFDGLHRLTGMSGANSATYSYDGSGNRLQAIRGGTTTQYVYDAAGNLLCETDASNNVTRYYIYGAGLLAMVTADATPQVYCYHFNATGSTVALTDANQAIVKSYAYDPFGNCNEAGDVNLTQPFKYVGQFGVMAEPNGFYYMRARYYDPKVGRFISEDPTGFGGGDVNLSNYVGGNPVNYVDWNGLELKNPIKEIPSLSDTYRNSKYVAPIADIAIGSIELGFAITTGVATVATVSQPELWYEVTAPAATATVEFGQAGWDRLTSGLSALADIVYDSNPQGSSVDPGGWHPPLKYKGNKPCP